MRFLFILVLVLSVFMAAFAAFILPREHLNMVLAQLPAAVQSGLESTGWVDDFLPGETVGRQSDWFYTSSHEPDGVIARASGIPIGNWHYQCEKNPVSDSVCSITHQIAEGGKVKFSWQITVDASGRMRARWQTLTGILVDHGIVLETSGQKPLTLPYSKCVAGYCESAADLNPKFIETLLLTDRTTATVHDSAGEPVTYAISVDGLAASLRMLGDSNNRI